ISATAAYAEAPLTAPTMAAAASRPRPCRANCPIFPISLLHITGLSPLRKQTKLSPTAHAIEVTYWRRLAELVCLDSGFLYPRVRTFAPTKVGGRLLFLFLFLLSPTLFPPVSGEVVDHGYRGIRHC